MLFLRRYQEGFEHFKLYKTFLGCINECAEHLDLYMYAIYYVVMKLQYGESIFNMLLLLFCFYIIIVFNLLHG